jgi:hypothetical protein
MNNPALLENIKYNILLAQESRITYEMVYANSDTFKTMHEFLFFIKPEITVHSEQINLDAIFGLVFDKFDQYDLQVKDIRILAASYLEKYDIIARHYGVINALSRKPMDYFSREAEDKFRVLYGKDPRQVTVLGGIEFLQCYPALTPFTLDELWQHSKTEKLAGGMYCAVIPVEGKDVYLINGFHPRQLIHFTEKGRCIVAFTLTGNTDWSIARNNFIGKTNPADALPGSLRNEILNRKQEFGIQEVSSSQNGFHLSAGPVEGLVELIRYCSDYSSGKIKDPEDFLFGRQLKAYFNQEDINLICSNQLVENKGEKIRTFDLTEEKNSSEALQLLKESVFT